LTINGKTKMQKIDRLILLNQKLDDIVQFDRNNGDGVKTGIALGGGVALGGLGLKSYQAIKKRQAANVMEPELPKIGEGPGVGAAKPVFGKGFGAAAGAEGKSLLERAKAAFSAFRGIPK
jgi:hypothetical protein